MKLQRKTGLKTLAVAILSLVTLGTMSFGVMAQPWAGPNDFCQERNPEQSKDRMERRQLMMAEMLDLTPTQQQLVNQLLTAQNEEMSVRKQQKCEIGKALNEQMQMATLNETAVRTLVEQEATVKADEMIAAHHIKAQIALILTPEQQLLADKMKKLQGPGGPRGRHEIGF